MDQKNYDSSRWWVVVGALLLQLCLGAIYAWGAFTTTLQSNKAALSISYAPSYSGADASKHSFTLGRIADPKGKLAKETDLERKKLLKAEIQNIKQESMASLNIKEEFWKKNYFGFTGKQTSWIFAVGLFCFAITMILAGRLQDKYGPRKVALMGGVTVAVGYILGGLLSGTSFWAMLFFIGVIGGIGIGLGYVCPIAACMKWFPDKAGLVTGLAVAGFGAGAFFFVKLAGSWGNLVATTGIHNTFLVFGVIFLVACIIGALLLSDPPEGYKPAGWEPPQAAAGSGAPAVKDLKQGEIVKTVTFWLPWLAFVFSAGCGLMVIKCLKNFGVNEIGMSAAIAGSALGLLSLFNGLGRIVWGSIAGKMGARLSIIAMTLLQGVMAFAIFFIGRTELGLAIAACWLGFNFGGNFALFPLITKDLFGTKYFGQNYGAMFTAYGIGGIAGPILAGGVWDSMQTFKWAFFIAAIACLLAAALAFIAKPPKAAEA